MTELIVVERVLDAPTTMSELQAREDAVAWCLQQYRVTGLCTFLAADGTRAVCVYRAPDVESVRQTQRQGGLPVEHAWAATVRGDPQPATLSDVIVAQREFSQPQTLALVDGILAERGHCLDMHRATLHVSYLSRDGLRMVCVFTAPDAESVRIANRQIQIPFTAVWSGKLHRAA